VRLLRLLLLLTFAPGCRSADVPEFHGVRLGMTARDVRSRFDLPGTWANETTPSVALEFSPAVGSRDLAKARFEFHSGSLVAVRAESPRALNIAGFETGVHASSGSVIDVAPLSSSGGTTLRWIARDCPVHAAEVTQILGSR
jgi:hypothetical protein